MKSAQLPTQEYLNECFRYDQKTGYLFWKFRPRSHFNTLHTMNAVNGRFANAISGSPDTCGYIMVTVNGKKRLAHRLIWCLITGAYPPNQIDHINHNPADNRIINLRLATGEENQRNQSLNCKNTSGFTGVTWNKAGQKWKAQFRINGECIFLGYFTDKSEAIKSREKANIKYGFHPNHGGSK